MNVYVALGAWVLVVHKASIATLAPDGVGVGPLRPSRAVRAVAHKIIGDESHDD
jgi:hypothetical protein